MGKQLRIDIYLADGSVAKFFQEDEPGIAQIISSITPARFFREGVLILGGSFSATAYPTSAITHVSLDYDALPNWADVNDESPFFEIPREQFISSAQAPADQATPRVRAPGDALTTYARLGLHGGGKIYIEIRTHITARLEQRQVMQRLFQVPCYVIRRESGTILLNTANLIGVSFFPGPPELPNTAWPVHHYIEPREEAAP